MVPKHWIIAIVAALVLIASISSLVPAPDHRIRIDAMVRAISFETEGEYPKRIIEPLAALTFVVAGFDEFELSPERLELAEQSIVDPMHKRSSSTTWQRKHGPRTFHGKAEGGPVESSLGVWRTSDGTTTTWTSPLIVVGRPTRVTLFFGDDDGSTLRAEVEPPVAQIEIVCDSPFLLQLGHVTLSPPWDRLLGPSNYALLRAWSVPSSPLIQISSASRIQTFDIELEPVQSPQPFASSELSVKNVSLERRDPSGNRMSTIKTAIVSYPDHPQKEPAQVQPHEFVNLGYTKDLRIRELTLDWEAHAIRVQIDGMGNRLPAGLPSEVKNQSLSLFEWVAYQPWVQELIKPLTFLFSLWPGKRI